MIIITGAAGFIGSNMIGKLNREGYNDLVAVDDFSREDKNKNLDGKKLSSKIDREIFPQWLKENHRFVQIIIHLGARTDTTEFDKSVFDKLNSGYSREIWKLCCEFGLPLIYASSAATYGLGELGYNDDHEVVSQLKPLNPYGESKNEFDLWALSQAKKPYFWAGLKFFNVYGPNEYHKGRMASVILHAYRQIRDSGKMKLFRSHNPLFRDGEQQRDFIWVGDVTNVILWFMLNRKHSGLYNLGTGKARTFLDLVKGTFAAMSIPEQIEFIDTPADIRDKYQYFTEANMKKLSGAGYTEPFTGLEEGINIYVRDYLKNDRYF
jgi:ADP-L-glycero-D-manno-heptose 6-epimerase